MSKPMSPCVVRAKVEKDLSSSCHFVLASLIVRREVLEGLQVVYTTRRVRFGFWSQEDNR